MRILVKSLFNLLEAVFLGTLLYILLIVLVYVGTMFILWDPFPFTIQEIIFFGPALRAGLFFSVAISYYIIAQDES